MNTSNTAVPPATGAVPSAHETVLTVSIVSSSSRALRPLSAAAQGSAYLLTHLSWTSRIGTGFRKWSFSRPRRFVATSPASSSTRRCFMTPNRVIGSRASSAVSVCPSCVNPRGCWTPARRGARSPRRVCRSRRRRPWSSRRTWCWSRGCSRWSRPSATSPTSRTEAGCHPLRRRGPACRR